jgi:hypothetical protein
MNINSAAATMRIEPAGDDLDFWTIHVPVHLRAGLFPLGAIHIFDARDVLPEEDILTALVRHGLGDWGLVPAPWRARNTRALRGARDGTLISAYASTGLDLHFFVITEVRRRHPRSGVFLFLECSAFASAFWKARA